MKLIESIYRTDTQTQQFSELIYKYRIPLDGTTYVYDFNILNEKNLLFVLTANPLSLWTFKLGEKQAKKFYLSTHYFVLIQIILNCVLFLEMIYQMLHRRYLFHCEKKQSIFS